MHSDRVAPTRTRPRCGRPAPATATGGLHVGEHPPSQRQHRVAGGEGDSAAGAVHQGCAQFVFSTFNCRLRVGWATPVDRPRQ